MTFEYSLNANRGGRAQKVSISTTSAQSGVLSGVRFAVVTPSVECFYRCDSNPTAVSDGTDDILLAGHSYRINDIRDGDKMAFITASGTGSVYISPGA